MLDINGVPLKVGDRVVFSRRIGDGSCLGVGTITGIGVTGDGFRMALVKSLKGRRTSKQSDEIAKAVVA